MIAVSLPRVVLYVRVSTKRQADSGMSIEDQKSRLTAHCREKGWSIAGVYEDPGYSAKTMRRPGLTRLLADAERKPRQFDLVLAMDSSRVSRVTINFLTIHGLLAKHSIRLTCLDLPDDMGPEGKLIATVLASVAELDNARRAERVQQVMETNAINGYWNGGHPPFGYRAVAIVVDGKSRTRKHLEIDPKEAETVRRVFDLYLKGESSVGRMGVGKIAEKLSISNDLTRSDKPWSVQAINDILRDATYIGQHRYHLHHLESGAEKNTQVRDVVVMPCPAIVDIDVFKRVQAKLDAANPDMQSGRLTNGSLMVTGLLHCAACGAMMHIVTAKGGRYRYYVCGHRHRTKRIGCDMSTSPLQMVEDAVADALCRAILTSDLLPSLATSIQRAMGAARTPLEAELRSKQAALNASERNRKNMVRRLSDVTGRSLKDLKRMLKIEEETGTRLANEVTALRARMRKRVSTIGPSHFAALSKLISNALQNGSLPLRQDFARHIIENIEFDGSQLSVSLRPGALETASSKAA
jgi:DNA invertase Pin-like site-specific DNA recombinase